MRNYSQLTAVVFFAVSTGLWRDAIGQDTNSPFEVTIECIDNPDCAFTGNDIPLRIKIQNKSPDDVFLTTDYMRMTGPYSTLRDSRTGKEWHGHTRLGSDELLSRYELIGPWSFTTVQYKLYKEELRIFSKNGKAIDLIVKFEFLAKWRKATGERKDFDSIGTVRVTQIDQYDR